MYVSALIPLVPPSSIFSFAGWSFEPSASYLVRAIITQWPMRFTAKKSLRTLIHYRSCERAYGVRRGNRSCDLDQDPKRILVASLRRKRSSRILLAVLQHLEVSIGGSSRSVHLECIFLRRTTTPALRCDRRGIDIVLEPRALGNGLPRTLYLLVSSCTRAMECGKKVDLRRIVLYSLFIPPLAAPATLPARFF